MTFIFMIARWTPGTGGKSGAVVAMGRRGSPNHGDIVPQHVVRKLLKPKRAAQLIDSSVRQIYYLEERGEIEMVRDGRAAYVVAESLDAYVTRLRAKAAAARCKPKDEHAQA